MSRALVLVGSMATRHVLQELCAGYRNATGIEVEARAMGGVAATDALRQGAQADVVVLAEAPMRRLEAEGTISAGSLKLFARSQMALGLPAGVASPAIDTVAGLQAVLRAAGRVGYSTGPSGDHFKALWTRWGFDDTPGLALVQAPAGVPVARLIAEGAAGAGVQQLSELIGQPGVQVAGVLPEGAQQATDFLMGIANSSRMSEARRLCDWLSAPDKAPVLERHGLSTALL